MVPLNAQELNKLLADGAEVHQGNPFIEATIVSVGDLVRIVESRHLGSFQYRSVASVDYELKPSLTRKGGPVDTGLGPTELWRRTERHILDDF